jgi:hypothetical protein
MLKGMLDLLKYSDKNNLNILYNEIVNEFNDNVKMIKKFQNNEVKKQIIEILSYINFKKVKRQNKKFKLNKFYQKIMKKIKKKIDL